MTLISFQFLLFVCISLIAYYLVPLKYRWFTILIANLIFYLSIDSLATVFVLLITAFSYFVALQLEKFEKGKKKRLLVSIGIIILFSILAALKICSNFSSFSARIIVPTGISYFTLSIVGYLLDVYWKKDTAEKNYFHLLTFVLYFPKIVQGPISRYKNLRGQLFSGNKISYENITFGAQLVLWGLFKKIVIADRMSTIVLNAYTDESFNTKGLLLLIAMILSALQLYFDFSGYTDMARGISQMFGITLEQNFNHPFFAKSASEFWQRWHMTLSGWFKDYLFLPISRTGFVKNLSKKMGNKYGPSARKKTMMIISTAVVWLATGLWHGTGINYIVWGLYWGSLIILSEVLENVFAKIRSFLHIKEEAPLWMLFRMIRTFFVFVIGKLISAQSTLEDVKNILKNVFTNSHISDLYYAGNIGLTKDTVLILAFGLITLLIISILQEKGKNIRECIAGWYAIPRWIFYSLALTIVLLFGIYGAGYDTSTFAYQFF